MTDAYPSPSSANTQPTVGLIKQLHNHFKFEGTTSSESYTLNPNSCTRRPSTDVSEKVQWQSPLYCIHAYVPTRTQ